MNMGWCCTLAFPEEGQPETRVLDLGCGRPDLRDLAAEEYCFGWMFLAAGPAGKSG